MKAPPTSVPLTRRSILFAGMLLGGVALSEGFRLAQTADAAELDVEALTPRSIGNWRSIAGPEVIVPRDRSSSKFYEQEVARAYGGAGLPIVMLSIAYGSRQDERLEVHRPETCYPAQGFRLAAARPMDLKLARDKSLPAQFILARRHDRTEQIIYWTRVGELFPRTSTEQKLAILRSSLALRVPDGILVRLSTLGTGPEDVAFMAQFARLLVQSSSSVMQRALAGPLSSSVTLERP